MEQLHARIGRVPSADDVSFYRARGWFIARDVIPTELLDDAVTGAERCYQGERDSRLPLAGGFLDWKPEHGHRIRLNDYVSLQIDELRALAWWPGLAAFAARLAGVRRVRLFHDQLVCKPPGLDEAGVIGWHVDKAYWMTCTSESMLTAWIPLQDCTVEMGPLVVLDRSHIWPGTEWMATFGNQDMASLEARLKSADHAVERVPLALSRGDVSFHHCRTVHGSQANTGTRERIALTVHYQDGDNRYRPHLDCRGSRALHLNDLLCRREESGSPDYSDPDVCPLLWDEDSVGGVRSVAST